MDIVVHYELVDEADPSTREHRRVTVVLTEEQVRALSTVPQMVIPPPGPGKHIAGPRIDPFPP